MGLWDWLFGKSEKKKYKKLHFIKGNILRFPKGSYYSENSASGDYSVFYKVKSGKVKTKILKEGSPKSNYNFSEIELVPITNKAYIKIEAEAGDDRFDTFRVKTFRIILYKSKTKHRKIVDLRKSLPFN